MTGLKSRYLLWCATLAMILACVPVLPTPAVSVPTIDPNAIGTMIMETAAAASTQTVSSLPSATPTVETPTPRNTDTPEPTATNTVIFILFSPTANGSISGSNGSGVSGGSSSDPYACKVTNTSPVNGSALSAREDFDARWTVINIGQQDWDRKVVDYLYLGGDKIHKVATYDLPASVKRGESVSLVVDMLAPKDPGSYTTAWGLKTGTTTFCPLTLTIVVNN